MNKLILIKLKYQVKCGLEYEHLGTLVCIENF